MKFLITLLICCSVPMFAQDPLQQLEEGNKRFAQSSAYERKKLFTSQSPFCAILACADSRVAPELIFDQGLGDLFVVRIAGNVATEGAIESLDFAANVLGVSLIIVMGHQHCGAINAVMTHKGEKELGTLASLIQPSVKGKESLREGIIANVKGQVNLLKKDKLLKNLVEQGKLQIVGAYYDFSSGLVEFFKD